MPAGESFPGMPAVADKRGSMVLSLKVLPRLCSALLPPLTGTLVESPAASCLDGSEAGVLHTHPLTSKDCYSPC